MKRRSAPYSLLLLLFTLGLLLLACAEDKSENEDADWSPCSGPDCCDEAFIDDEDDTETYQDGDEDTDVEDEEEEDSQDDSLEDDDQEEQEEDSSTDEDGDNQEGVR